MRCVSPFAQRASTTGHGRDAGHGKIELPTCRHLTLGFSSSPAKQVSPPHTFATKVEAVKTACQVKMKRMRTPCERLFFSTLLNS